MPKVCSVCNLEKDVKDFYFKNKDKGWLHAQCKSCYSEKRKSFMPEHYAKYGDVYRSRARTRKATVKKIRQNQLYDYLEYKSCEQCGFSDIRALDFDHLDPAIKKFSIARAINDCYSWEKILLEIRKCQILCSNCHRIRTAEQYNWRKGRPEEIIGSDSALNK